MPTTMEHPSRVDHPDTPTISKHALRAGASVFHADADAPEKISKITDATAGHVHPGWVGQHTGLLADDGSTPIRLPGAPPRPAFTPLTSTNVRLKKAHFRELMEGEFGPVRAASLSRDHVFLRARRPDRRAGDRGRRRPAPDLARGVRGLRGPTRTAVAVCRAVVLTARLPVAPGRRVAVSDRTRVRLRFRQGLRYGPAAWCRTSCPQAPIRARNCRGYPIPLWCASPKDTSRTRPSTTQRGVKRCPLRTAARRSNSPSPRSRRTTARDR